MKPRYTEMDMDHLPKPRDIDCVLEARKEYLARMIGSDLYVLLCLAEVAQFGREYDNAKDG